jgi:hypothetical protein
VHVRFNDNVAQVNRNSPLAQAAQKTLIAPSPMFTDSHRSSISLEPTLTMLISQWTSAVKMVLRQQAADAS